MEHMSPRVLFERKPAWRATCNIKNLISDDAEDGDDLRPTAKAIATKLRSCKPFMEDPGAESLCKSLERVTKRANLARVNGLLEWAYDIADEKRIWLG